VVAEVTPGKAPLLDTQTSGLGKKRRTGQLVGRSHGGRADGGMEQVHDVGMSVVGEKNNSFLAETFSKLRFLVLPLYFHPMHF
jgi:hypothetical protein